MEKKNIITYLIIFGSIIIFLLIYGSGGIVSPFYGDINLIDEGQFASWVSRMNLGGQLYKDVYAAYGPLYIYPLYVFSLIFEPSVFLIRMVYGVLSVFLAIIIAISIFKKLKITVLFQLLPLFLLTFIPGFGVRQAMGLLTILLIYISFEKRKFAWGMAAGISIACAFLIGSDTGIFTLMTCAVLIIWEVISSKNLKHVYKILSSIILGSGFIFILFFIWSSSEGWFFYYLSSTFDDLTSYSGTNIPLGQKNMNPLEIFIEPSTIFAYLKFIFSKGIMIYWVFLFYLIMFIFLTIKMIKNKFYHVDKLILLICIYGFLLSTILIGRNGHLSYIAPPIFILFGYILHEVNKKFVISITKKDKLVLVMIVLTIFIFSERLVLIHRPSFDLIFKVPLTILDKKDNPEYIGNIYISNEQKMSFLGLEKYVNQNISSNEKIFFFSNEPMMYLVANRKNPNRYDLPMVVNTKEKRIEILNSLIQNKTKYIIEDMNAWSVDGISNRRRMPEIYEYILENYSKEDYGQFIIYRLREN